MDDLTGYCLVKISWLNHIMSQMENATCPFCGSTAAPVIDKGNNVIKPRRGCTDCGKWWDPVEHK